MNTIIDKLEIENSVDELLLILDKDIEHLEDNISRLDQLRSSVVKQDNDSLTKLLATIQSESKIYHSNELKRLVLRKKLAAVFNCDPKEITLSRLGTHLTTHNHVEITKRKSRLQELIHLLKKEYSSTQFLLADCARFNRLLLKNIFQTGQSENLTYKPTGAAERQRDTVFMNLQI